MLPGLRYMTPKSLLRSWSPPVPPLFLGLLRQIFLGGTCLSRVIEHKLESPIFFFFRLPGYRYDDFPPDP